MGSCWRFRQFVKYMAPILNLNMKSKFIPYYAIFLGTSVIGMWVMI